MRRSIVLGVLLAAGALSVAVGAYQPAAGQQPKVIEVEKLKDNFWVLKGAGSGGNTSVFVTTNGVVVVDTKNPGWGQPLLDKIKELTSKPITTVINTHTHFDHVSGNVEFPTNIDIVVQENTKSNMEKMAPVTGLPAKGPTPNIFKENNGKGLPKRTFKDRLSIGKGADQVDLYYFGRGHTNGDAWVVFPALRIMAAGDIFAGKNLPLLDANNGGSGVAIGDSLAKAHSTVKNVDTIVTGHSVQMTMTDLKEFSDFNKEFLAAVRDGKKAGKSVDELAASWKMPPKYTGYGPVQEPRLKSNLQVIYNELSKSTN